MPRIDPRTLAEAAAVEAGGETWLPGAREAFIARAEAFRDDPVNRLLESRAADAGVPRLVDVGSDRLDAVALSAGALARLLRAVFDAGRGYGRGESDAVWRETVQSFLTAGYSHPAPLAGDLAARVARDAAAVRRAVSGV